MLVRDSSYPTLAAKNTSRMGHPASLDEKD